jgi:hypothetical protein
MPELVHFLTGHGYGYASFAAKVAQVNLKESDKCVCDSEQIAKYFWELCVKSKLKHSAIQNWT